MILTFFIINIIIAILFNVETFGVDKSIATINSNSSKRYYLSVYLQVKDEVSSLLEFMKHYTEEGVDHVFIFDDDSADDTTLALHQCIDHTFYTLFTSANISYNLKDTANLTTRKLKGKQHPRHGHNQAENDGIENGGNYSDPRQQNRNQARVMKELYGKFIRPATEWLLVVDVDEFVTSRASPQSTIKDILVQHFSSECDVVSIPWLLFSWGSMQYTPSNSLRGALFHRWGYDKIYSIPEASGKFHNRHLKVENKVLFRTDAVPAHEHVHIAIFGNYTDPSEELQPNAATGKVCIPRLDSATPMRCAHKVTMEQKQKLSSKPLVPDAATGYWQYTLHRGIGKGIVALWCPFSNRFVATRSPTYTVLREEDIPSMQMVAFHYRIKSEMDWQRKMQGERFESKGYSAAASNPRVANRLDIYDTFMVSTRAPERIKINQPDYIRAMNQFDNTTCSAKYFSRIEVNITENRNMNSGRIERLNKSASLDKAALTAQVYKRGKVSTVFAMNRPVPVHYIFINKTDKYSTEIPIYLKDMFTDVKRRLSYHIDLRVSSYAKLLEAVLKYDGELAKYFTMINSMYPTMHANIGRAVLLYQNGGVYHDLKESLQSVEALHQLATRCNDRRGRYTVIFEVNPIHRKHMRMTNMAACRPGSLVLNIYLQLVKLELRNRFLRRDQGPYDWFGTKIMLDLVEKNSTCRAGATTMQICQFFQDDKEEDFVIEKFMLQYYSTKRLYNDGTSTHWTNLHVPLLVIPENLLDGSDTANDAKPNDVSGGTRIIMRVCYPCLEMDTTDAPQIIEHIHKSINFTPYDTRWVPFSARFVAMGIHANAKGALNVYQLNNGDLDLIVEGKTANGVKCGTFGASSIEDRYLATGDHVGKLVIYDLENINTPIFSQQAHSSIINAIDGCGGLDIGYGAPEIVTGGRDGCVRLWDPRVQEPVLALEPGEGQPVRDCWTVAFGNSYSDEDRCIVAGYDNGDVKLFDLRTNSMRYETNVGNGVTNIEFDRKDIEMNKMVITTLESRFRVFDMRTQHPTEGFSCLSEKAHKATVWCARHLPQNRDLFMTGGGNGGFNMYKYHYPKSRTTTAKDNVPMGVVGTVELLNSKVISSQPIVSMDWSPDKEGLCVLSCLDQTIRSYIVTKLNKY